MYIVQNQNSSHLNAIIKPQDLSPEQLWSSRDILHIIIIIIKNQIYQEIKIFIIRMFLRSCSWTLPVMNELWIIL